MTLSGSIVDRLPGPVPKSTIQETERQEVEQADDGGVPARYTVSKTPFEALVEVTAVVDGVEQTFTDSGPIRARSISSTGLDTVEFQNGTRPDVGTTLEIRYNTEPNVVSYLSQHNAELDSVSDDLEQVFANKSVESAESQALDLLGDQYGPFGDRRGRTDTEYRAYLRSLIPAFSARGTRDDIKLAVSAATGVPESEISIIEDTTAVGIEVAITSDTVVEASSQLSEVINLALPSGVELLSDPSVLNQAVFVAFETASQTTQAADGLGSGTLGGGSVGDSGGVQSLN
jgi:hypothetical protein